jgi:hypothetical protein
MPLVSELWSGYLPYTYSESLVLAQYLFKLGGSTATPWQQKGVAVAAYTVAVGRKNCDTLCP